MESATVVLPRRTVRSIYSYLANLPPPHKPSTVSEPSSPCTLQSLSPLGEPSPKYHLTQHNLSVFDIDAQSSSDDSTMSEDDPSLSEKSARKNKTINCNDAHFETLLERHSVFYTADEAPRDWTDIKSRILDTTVKPLYTNSARDTATARRVMMAAPNEGLILCEAIHALVPVAALFLSNHYDAIVDAQWDIEPLPYQMPLPNKLTRPKPDMTIGFKERIMTNYVAIELLKPHSSPVICRTGLIFPSFCVEANSLRSARYSELQNRHNGAHMLRSLLKLRQKANNPDWEVEFFNVTTALTLSVQIGTIGLYGHWAVKDGGKVSYHSRDILTWVTKHENYEEICDSVSRAIQTILERNEQWIEKDLEKIQREIQCPKRSLSLTSLPEQNSKRQRCNLTQTTQGLAMTRTNSASP